MGKSLTHHELWRPVQLYRLFLILRPVVQGDLLRRLLLPASLLHLLHLRRGLLLQLLDVDLLHLARLLLTLQVLPLLV